MIGAPALAQLYDEDGYEVFPDGAGGHYGQAQLRAQLEMGGGDFEVLEGRAEYQDYSRTHLYYKYTIEAATGAVFDAVYDGADGALLRYEIVDLSDDDPALEIPYILDEDDATERAIEYAEAHEFGILRAKGEDIKAYDHEGMLAYLVTVKKAKRLYEAVIDVITGEVLSFGKARN